MLLVRPLEGWYMTEALGLAYDPSPPPHAAHTARDKGALQHCLINQISCMQTHSVVTLKALARDVYAVWISLIIKTVPA